MASRGAQLSLFGTPGRGLLFSPGVLTHYLEEHREVAIPNEAGKAHLVRHWVDSLTQSEATEASLEQQFVQTILVELLGYTPYPSPSASPASLFMKPPSRLTQIARKPDGMLGSFAHEEFRFTAALELKSPDVALDAPQAREQNETPIEQGFHYGRKILGVQWVIVSDMKLVRLYSVESDVEYEQIDLGACVDRLGNPTPAFRKLHFLLHHDYLVDGHDQAPVSRLYAKSIARELQLREHFYEAYSRIRADLYDAIRMASSRLSPIPARADLLEATQRLLDRLLFIYYCEDHPDQLIPNGTVERVTAAARALPGEDADKVYRYLKALFREVDAGSPTASGVHVAGYNGELFKNHWIIDHIELPDSLHDRTYTAGTPEDLRRIQGVWGLHVYDFWAELSEHLLGHVFEESLSDLVELGAGTEASLDDKLRERKQGGIFYTTHVLSDFLAASAISSILNERAPLATDENTEILPALETRLNAVIGLKILDPACGSGAFLASVYSELLHEFWKLRDTHERLAHGTVLDLFRAESQQAQASLLRDCLFGIDKLPQAVEIAKLALWLRSARKNEKVPHLTGNVVAGDSLAPDTFTLLNAPFGSFDLVIGNPPWGGEVDPEVYAAALARLGLSPDETWDSWELFLMLGLAALREGGRLALVLPDSMFYPKKAKVRELLFSLTRVEKVHGLGPDWFGKTVRMGTILVQARRGPTPFGATLEAMLLAGDLRTRAIRGEVPLTQIEAQRGKRIPIRRIVESPTHELEIFRGDRDDRLMAGMSARSTPLSDLCERGRGEEMSKTGLFWRCPSCLTPSTPGTKKKGGGFNPTTCPACGISINAETAVADQLVSTQRPAGTSAPFVDGDDLTHRYQQLRPRKWMRLDLSGWDCKDAALYAPPKILLRQAGVGVVASLDRTEARCPQSLYIYRLTNQARAQGYAEEFVLGALVSRSMAFYVFKRFGEVDPAKAHAKLTHDRLAALPIPTINFADTRARRLHDSIVQNVRRLIDGSAALGGQEDRATELALRELWGVGAEDGLYINNEFADLPDSQPLRDLFPDGVPRPTVVFASDVA